MSDQDPNELPEENLPAGDTAPDDATDQTVKSDGSKKRVTRKKITPSKIKKAQGGSAMPSKIESAVAEAVAVMNQQQKSVAPSQTTPTVPTSKPDSVKPSAPRRDVNASLEAIYHDKDGSLPDMKKLEVKKTSWLTHVFGWLFVVAALAAVAYFGSIWYFGNGRATVGDNVAITIKTPESITLGATSTFSVIISNSESVSLRQAVLELYYPNGFVVTETSEKPTNAGKNEWLLGTIPAREDRTINISGHLFAPVNGLGTIRALVSYQPDGFESTFQKNTHANAVVNQSPFSLVLKGPPAGVIGVPATYYVTVNRDGLVAKSLMVSPDFPSTFHLTSSSIPVQKNGRWNLEKNIFSTTTNEATFSFTGLWDEDADTTNTISAELFLTTAATSDSLVVAQSTVTTTLGKNEAALMLAVNGSTSDQTVQPGDALSVTVQLTNNNKTTLRNGTVSLVFEGPAIKKQSIFDWANITDKADGSLTGEAVKTGVRRGTVVWDMKTIPALKTVAPGESVSIEVKLPIHNTKNFDWSVLTPSTTLTVAATGKFSDDSGKSVTVSSQPLALTPRSDVALEVRDDAAGTDNPAHNITWVITNSLHALKDITLTATLYGDVSLTAPSSTAAQTIAYDKKTKLLTWTVHNMPVDLDVLALPFTVTINTKNPTQTELVSKVRFKATDSVSGETLDLLGEAITLGAPQQ